MENTEIRCLSQLEASQVQQTAALLVDSFYSMFKGITKERELLQRLFTPCMQLDLIYVLLKEDRVAGLIAVSDSRRRAIVMKEETCVSVFGPVKGKIFAWQLGKMLSIPAVKGDRSGYVDFIATSPEYRRKGVGGQLLTFAESGLDFDELYLDVLKDNLPAVSLYEKMGYRTETLKKSILMRLAGIKAMYIMKKKLR
ncbi:GNAT family N-acetyltransferase [Hungatella effluvii]|uniref:GNAT family N-acetyltransferase n=1 Tax=Hungatella effluvii TaxID=1096246 RepID=UPI0022E3A8C0|nr:GNAT family N-acetyltransferase [Hungatella effluvii]